MDSRTVHRTLSSKGTLFKLGLTDDSNCERCPEEDKSATHILCDCEAIAHLRGSWDSLVGIATGYGLDDQWEREFESR
jgi:hypothetical protein